MGSKIDNSVAEYVKRKTGISISKLLRIYINEPDRIAIANNQTLEKLVKEYAPIYKLITSQLDGLQEAECLAIFSLYLLQKINNRPGLRNFLGIL